jgi:asparagine synthetase A
MKRRSKMVTVQEITSFKSKIYSLAMMKAVKSVANVKRQALARFSVENEDTQQWIADMWFGRCAKKSYQDVVVVLS